MGITKSKLTPMDIKCVTAVNSLTDGCRQLGREGKPCTLFLYVTGNSTEGDIKYAVETLVNSAIAADPRLDDITVRCFMFVVYTAAATAYAQALSGSQKEAQA